MPERERERERDREGAKEGGTQGEAVEAVLSRWKERDRQRAQDDTAAEVFANRI